MYIPYLYVQSMYFLMETHNSIISNTAKSLPSRKIGLTRARRKNGNQHIINALIMIPKVVEAL